MVNGKWTTTTIYVSYRARHWPNYQEQFEFSVLLMDTSACAHVGIEPPKLWLVEDTGVII